MADPELAHTLEHARQERVRVAGMLVAGVTDISVLAEYRKWLTISRLLGDVSEAEADASYGRACNILAASAGKAIAGPDGPVPVARVPLWPPTPGPHAQRPIAKP